MRTLAVGNLDRFMALEWRLDELALTLGTTGKALRKTANDYSIEVRRQVIAILSEQVYWLERERNSRFKQAATSGAVIDLAACRDMRKS